MPDTHIKCVPRKCRKFAERDLYEPKSLMWIHLKIAKNERKSVTLYHNNSYGRIVNTQFTIGSTECLNVYIHHIIDSQGTLFQVIQDSRLKAIRICLKIHRIYDRSGYWQLPFFIQNTPSPVQCFKKNFSGLPQ